LKSKGITVVVQIAVRFGPPLESPPFPGELAASVAILGSARRKSASRAAMPACHAGRGHGLFADLRIGSGSLELSESCMKQEDVAARNAIQALTSDAASAWEAFVRIASRPVWRASLHAAPRRPLAEVLFSHLMERLHLDRLGLAARVPVDASSSQNALAFLDREIDGHIGNWLVELFRARSAEAAEALVRVFHADLRAWVQRAKPLGARANLDDRVQEAYAALLEQDGRRIRLYGGTGTFRAFLRITVINLVNDAERREQGRVRPRLAFARLSDIEQRAYRLLYEERLPAAEAARRLDHVDAHQAVQKVLALGDLGTTHSGRRPRLIALDNGEQAFDLPDGRDNPEDELLAREGGVVQAEREAALIQALRALPAAQRNILEQRFLLGRKPREIATETGIEIKEIYRILERTVAQLKHLLARPS